MWRASPKLYRSHVTERSATYALCNMWLVSAMRLHMGAAAANHMHVAQWHGLADIIWHFYWHYVRHRLIAYAVLAFQGTHEDWQWGSGKPHMWTRESLRKGQS